MNFSKNFGKVIIHRELFEQGKLSGGSGNRGMTESLENLSKFGFAEGLTKKLASDVLVTIAFSSNLTLFVDGYYW